MDEDTTERWQMLCLTLLILAVLIAVRWLW